MNKANSFVICVQNAQKCFVRDPNRFKLCILLGRLDSINLTDKRDYLHLRKRQVIANYNPTTGVRVIRNF